MSAGPITPGLPDAPGFGEEPLYWLTRVYLLFLQGLFKQFPEGSHRWSDDERLSEISILDQAPIPKDRVEQRPALITMRGPAQFGNLSLDNMQKLDWGTGTKQRTDLVACTMTINCIAKNGVEAQRVAWIVMTKIRTFKTLLQQHGPIHKVGDEVSIGAESPPGSLVTPEADSELVLVPVYSPFFFQWTEKVTPLDAPAVRNIEVFMRASLASSSQLTTAGRQEAAATLRPPTIRGRVVGQASAPQTPLEVTVKT